MPSSPFPPSSGFASGAIAIGAFFLSVTRMHWRVGCNPTSLCALSGHGSTFGPAHSSLPVGCSGSLALLLLSSPG
eukprot:1219046-Pyramimonas_sp.AAC.1